MNYLTFLDRMARCNRSAPPQNFLVSGADAEVCNGILNGVYQKSGGSGRPLIIVDDAKMANANDIRSAGYQIVNALSGYCIYDPFPIDNVKSMSRFRQLLTGLGYDERRKMKLISYLNFIKHLECLEKKTPDAPLSLEVLGKYSSSMQVSWTLDQLMRTGVIGNDEKTFLAAKYAEVSEAAADFEDMLFLLTNFTCGDSLPLNRPNTALVFPIQELEGDTAMRNLVIQLLLFRPKEDGVCPTLVILDKGYGSDRKCLVDLITGLPKDIDLHLFSGDVFTLCDEATLAMILNRFSVKVYTKHLAMTSCQAIEKLCGEMDVERIVYAESYDRRWKNNSTLDILLGNNKTQTYTKAPPVREPRYRKEMIAGFSAGSGIIEYIGNFSLFCI